MHGTLMAPLEHPGKDGEEVRIEEEVEVEPAKIAHSPKQPSAQEEEDHRVDHADYRSWCKWCVMGRARGQHHVHSKGSLIPIVGVDYFFITTEGLKKRKELLEMGYKSDAEIEADRVQGKLIKCVLTRCFDTKCLFAHCIPCKGADEEQYVANLVLKDILWLGHTKLILKGDNERSLQALIGQVMQKLRVEFKNGENVTKEDPAKYDSQSNGGIEVGVMLVRGLFRTLKLCLESRIDQFITVGHPVVPWLLEHTCMILNTRHRGEDGLTAWARVRGRAFNQKLVGFGEAVLYKLPMKGPHHDPDGNMGTRWREALFVGYHRASNVYVLIGEEGVVAARSLMRRPAANRWSAERVMSIKATPWSERERTELKVRLEEAPAPEKTSDLAPANPRRFRINKKDLEEHGYTDGCVQCDHIMRYGLNKAGVNHSDRCRTRMITEIGRTELGQQRLSAWSDRVDRAIAEQIEHADKDKQQPMRREDVAGDGRPDGGVPTGVHNTPSSSTTTAQTAASSSGSPDALTRGGSGEGSFLPADEPAKAKPWGVDDVGAGMGLPDDAMDDSDAESRCPRDSDGELVDNEGDEQAQPTAMEMGFLGSLEPSPCDVASEMLLMQLGGTGKAYKREARKGFRRLVSEIYSPPRVTEELRQRPRRWLLPGFALDITVADPDDGEPWDFTRPEKREKARRLRRAQRPYMLIGSPECKAFCTWQRLNESRSPDVERMKRLRVQAQLHIDFVASLYVDQMKDGLYFLHEHPRFASSWKLTCIEELLKTEGVGLVRGDQCQFGAQVQHGPMRGSPILKPTGFMSNSGKVLEALNRRCSGRDSQCSRPSGGRHTTLEGRVAREAARYPKDLCRAVLRGTAAQLRHDRRIHPGCFGIQAVDEDDQVVKNAYGEKQGYSGKFVDDISGQILKDEWVMEARMKELEYFTKKGVWAKVPRGRARQIAGRPPITVRWVDVNKGDELHPKYRSRLVARQIRALDKSGQSYFAPAPPIEALRTVISLAATTVGDHKPDWRPNSPTRTQISFVDVSRAYFNAKIDPSERETFVDLPAEDPDSATMCGQLLRHMYGTRPAADGWQEEYSTFLISLGFRQGGSCPNAFYQTAKKIACSVHGDDFTSSGPKDALDWLETKISEKYEITIGPRLGPGPEDGKEARALNRVVRWCTDKVEYEADPRQIEQLVADCGLEGAKTMATPGVKPTFNELEVDELLPTKLHTAFRGSAARGNYISADRIDCQFACKEVCRWMSKPNEQSWRALKRLVRYLSGLPRLVYVYRQQQASCVDVYTDTDWAGCPKTRKSTSGGCIMFGSHAIKHWSSTQASVTLSSGEAEFSGVIRGAGQGLGYQALLRDLGVDVPLRVWTDSSAAMGICTRQGLGKLRHLDTHTLWIQQAVRNKRIELRKVAGEENPADLLTKHSLSREMLQSLVKLYDCEFRNGRAESAPKLRRSATGKVTMAQSEQLGNVVARRESDLLKGAQSQEETVATNDVPYWMPHNTLTTEQLDERFPAVQVPEDDQLEDIMRDKDDKMLNYGREVARQIGQDMISRGRTRQDPGGRLKPE